jgi:1-acyl-sn-glycerol-3-phosphate acyltransferase
VPDGGRELIPGAHSRGFHRVFAWYLRRLLAKRFHAIRGEGDSVAVLDAAAAADAPVLLASNHGAWWDPLLGLWVHDRWFAGREPCSPIDAAMLAKFRFFRKLGMFGVHPDDPASLRAMARYVDGVLARDPRGMLLVTPQGRFVDPRLPVEVRPGIGLVASRHPRASVLVAALEYGFWTDQRPEVFFRVARVAPPADPADARAWHHSIELAMNANAAALASAVQSRDPARFTALVGAGRARINPFYDLFLRLTGRRGAIETSHRPHPGTGGAR